MMGYSNIEKTHSLILKHMKFSSLFHNIGVIEKVDKTLPWFEGTWQTISPNIREYNCKHTTFDSVEMHANLNIQS